MRIAILGALGGALLAAGVLAQTTNETPDPAAVGTEAPADTGVNAGPDVDAEPDPATDPAPAAPDPAKIAEGLELWGKIHQVFAHPRCANCHVGEDNRPRWSGPSYGKTRVHGMNVNAGASRIGAEYMPCATCHGTRNIDLPHAAPGAPNWQLPPAAFAWFGKTSAQICGQIKDPERNGGRTLAEIAEHVDHDALLQWAWAPGPGRQPAPFSRVEVTEMILEWEATGAPCPE